MIFKLIYIISLLAFGNDFNSELDKYIRSELAGYSRIDYSLHSPKDINFSKLEIDRSRTLKLKGTFLYVPVKMKKNKKINNSTLTYKTKLYKNVLVANKSLQRNEQLNINDFIVVEKEVTYLRSSPFSYSSAISNYRSKIRLLENDLLLENMVEKLPDIEIGDRIEAQYSKQYVNISFYVTARSAGSIGDDIKVKRDDKKLFKARVLNNSLVKIIEY